MRFSWVVARRSIKTRIGGKLTRILRHHLIFEELFQKINALFKRCYQVLPLANKYNETVELKCAQQVVIEQLALNEEDT